MDYRSHKKIFAFVFIAFVTHISHSYWRIFGYYYYSYFTPFADEESDRKMIGQRIEKVLYGLSMVGKVLATKEVA
ncbi:disease resistance protein RGA2-like protein [Corchorus olitorius]|uniref:Disease resistance protein RGA2-like protein n=1 Tax=Corchorus olitorius TaxID=93759 RepID=A0A1R3HLT3_9ROSI|nr:disease resistance protein RGA2-like protein [Corchorus olitorius]